MLINMIGETERQFTRQLNASSGLQRVDRKQKIFYSTAEEGHGVGQKLLLRFLSTLRAQ